MTGTVDMVNHPPHYTFHPYLIGESINFTKWMGCMQGNAFKYLWRYRAKNNPVEDLGKALFYLKEWERDQPSGVVSIHLKPETPFDTLGTLDQAEYLIMESIARANITDALERAKDTIPAIQATYDN